MGGGGGETAKPCRRPTPNVGGDHSEPGLLWAGSHLELVGGVEGNLADFGEAFSVAHGIAQRQLRELQQRRL